MILQVEFQPDAVVITYLTIPDDLRATGLQLTHQLVIPMDTDEYEQEVQAVLDALKALLADALDDVDNLPPHTPNEEDEHDEDEEESD
jgi:hypothetical protein